MKNKVELKKLIAVSLGFIIVFNLLFGMFYYYQYDMYRKNFNGKINGIIDKLKEEYPELKEDEVFSILNSKESSNEDRLKEYGIDINSESIVMENDKCFEGFVTMNIGLLSICFVILLVIFLKYNSSKDKKLKEITNYIEEINKKNYKLDIDDNTEDELSILKNELYKTTILLKEQAENSMKDKVNLKNSLSDISHQLKTPLTSIIIMLDNIIDNPTMEVSTREEFVKDIKREIVNINFLVQAILKLSKFDANSINFVNEEVEVKDIVDEAIKNISTLCDLKNVEIEVANNCKKTINCDSKWQVEAVTNILKNSVEYSKDFTKVIVSANENKVYTEILILDNGKGIDEKEIPHIFERFYKGRNSSKDSIGIGLALAKTIIESNGGSVMVQSEIGKGSRFVIRYYR